MYPDTKRYYQDLLLTTSLLFLSFLINLFVERQFGIRSLIPMISVLGVYVISLVTWGYLWGIIASLISVFIVNYAFTYPYYSFNFSIRENFFAAVIMMAVAVLTSTLATKVQEREQVEAEGEKEKMRANLLRAVSHDLRTPLTSIYGSACAIMENYDSTSRELHLQLLKEIAEDSQWLIRMVENLLSITRIGDEQVCLVKTPTVLEELVDTALVKFQKRYPDQKVHVQLPEEFICIPMDPLLIEQVLFNLLENAVLHAEGMRNLTLRVSTRGELAVFEVEDDGCGLSTDLFSSLLHGLSSHPDLHPPADGKRNNMGIGLSVCQSIIRAHGRSLEAENKRGGGVIFRFALEMESSEYEQQ